MFIKMSISATKEYAKLLKTEKLAFFCVFTNQIQTNILFTVKCVDLITPSAGSQDSAVYIEKPACAAASCVRLHTKEEI